MAAAGPMAVLSTLATRLVDPGAQFDDVLKALGEVKERLDVVHTAEFPRFLEMLLNPLMTLLSSRTSPQIQDNVPHRCV